MNQWKLSSVEETLKAGRTLGQRLSAGAVLALCGDLGAGKTHLVKGIAEGLGSCRDVTSPTFTLINEYPDGRLPIFHADLYRLETAGEAERIGLLDSLDGVTVVEWAEKFPELFSRETHWLRLRIVSENERILEEQSNGGLLAGD